MKMLEMGDFRLVKEKQTFGEYWSIYFIYHPWQGEREYIILDFADTLTEALAKCPALKKKINEEATKARNMLIYRLVHRILWRPENDK